MLLVSTARAVAGLLGLATRCRVLLRLVALAVRRRVAVRSLRRVRLLLLSRLSFRRLPLWFGAETECDR